MLPQRSSPTGPRADVNLTRGAPLLPVGREAHCGDDVHQPRGREEVDAFTHERCPPRHARASTARLDAAQSWTPAPGGGERQDRSFNEWPSPRAAPSADATRTRGASRGEAMHQPSGPRGNPGQGDGAHRASALSDDTHTRMRPASITPRPGRLRRAHAGRERVGPLDGLRVWRGPMAESYKRAGLRADEL